MSAEQAKEQNASALKHDKRLRRVLHGGASALLQRGFALLVGLISLPLTTRYLGPERYGIWVTVSTSIGMLAVLELGIANSLTNRISHAYAANDDRIAQTYYATALWMSTGISAITGMIGWLVWPYLHLERLVHTSSPALAHQTSMCYAIVFGFFLLGLPLNLSHRVLGGLQKTQIVNYFQIASSTLGLIAIVLGVRFHLDLMGLLLIFSGTLLTSNLLLNVWFNCYWRPSIFPWPNTAKLSLGKELLQSGSGFFVLQLAALVVFNSDNLVIAHYVDAASVMPYAITWRLANYATVLMAALQPSLWPAYSEAYARGNYEWVRRTFWLTMRTTLVIAVLSLTALAFFGRTVIYWYIGPRAVPEWPLLLAICAWTLVSTFMDVEACLLAAVDRVKLQGILSVVAAAINLALSIYLAKRIGPLGVVLGTAASYAIALVVPQSIEVYKALYHPPAPKVVAVKEESVPA
jgi:O-antigen/teichoic acid export membrane protein